MEDLQQILLERMQDVEGITKVSAFPLAIGWWFLILFFLIVIFSVAAFEYKKFLYKKNWRYSIKQELQKMLENFNPENAKQILSEFNELTKRVGMQIYGRNEVASLEGVNWLKWLNARDPKNFNWVKKGKLLIVYPYMPEEKISMQKKDFATLVDAFIDWL
ncbi:MAG: DUF4381 domain-containing protein [Rickettsiales bacterium]|nr:DUF4381 domain-containing protein [Rickettsiales bacterium]